MGTERDNVTYNPKPRNDQDVHLWMAEKPKKVLIQDRITTSCRVEKGGIKVTIC
jgi:hypothetical protein